MHIARETQFCGEVEKESLNPFVVGVITVKHYVENKCEMY
jgi:hypothetical protein